MDIGSLIGSSEVADIGKNSKTEFDKSATDKFDKLFDDDMLNELSDQGDSKPALNSHDMENKFNKLFDTGDFFKRSDTIPKSDIVNKDLTQTDNNPEVLPERILEPDYQEKREPNSEYEFNGNTYETDDKGITYKKNGDMIAETEYTINGNTYRTDENGNKVEVKSNPEYTEDGTRNMKEQKESGGEERQDDDDGGHLVARILGGSEGEENLVPMRRTINRGDYKKMENEISKALQEGKKVQLHIDIEYDGDSKRPSKLKAEYTIDGKRTETQFDNVEGSTDLLENLPEYISDEDYNRIEQRIEDMNEDGCEATITSVKVEYNENGEPLKITVGILDESTGEKSYRECEPR